MTAPRDLIGYGGKAPNPQWPGRARIAVQFVLNYEEGAENSVLHGDAGAESFLSDMVGAAAVEGARNMAMESLYEYGSRAGFWRLSDLFVSRGLPLTVFGVASALEQNPAAVEAMLMAGWEVASHGWRWINYQSVPEAIEREHIARAIAVHTRLTGQRPLGWYQGRTSPNTARLVVEEGGFLYDADSYADDLPYYDTRFGKPQLVVPYTLDANDMKFVALNGFTTPGQFFDYLKDAFDTLYAEGETAPKMMSVGLHCRIAGKPSRAAAVARFLDYVQQHDQVWVARRIDIARHWLALHPYETGA
ncbi:MAG TPA: allantoinase PuuE [Acidisoma sp.]|uniref:allantoinase PuuE n=1 Tax=Acidisoma sp. TaxID=1872115 RepID=UPI002B730D83|nr:allantoinase PuuE [Acidisoma sp.]HTI02756.1 allantoinase PuuE [Acidisoma sp.]